MTFRSSCSGRNYNFQCINVVFGVFLHESAPTAAKYRTNHSSHRRSCRKPIDRSGPNLRHVYRLIWAWTSAKKNTSRAPRGIWRGLGGHTYTNVGKMPDSWTDRDQIWHTYAYSTGNGHELTKNNPLIPEEHGGVMGSSIHKSGKASKPLERSGPNLAHVYRLIWAWTSAKTINPSRPKGHLEGVKGSQIQKCEKYAKQLYRSGPNLAHVCIFSWEWT